MKETTIKEIVKKAKELNERKKKWHFHMLSPDCTFNHKKKKHAFILENESGKVSYVVYSGNRYMEEGKTLVAMLHGKSILQKSKAQIKENPSIAKILERAKMLNNRRVSWHHHMLFPGCIFNSHKGKWVIIFEDKENNAIIESASASEPKEDLKKVEALFYAQKK